MSTKFRYSYVGKIRSTEEINRLNSFGLDRIYFH